MEAVSVAQTTWLTWAWSVERGASSDLYKGQSSTREHHALSPPSADVVHLTDKAKAHALNQINKGFLILCLWINYWPFSPKWTLCKDFNKYTSMVVDKTLFFLQRNKFSGERILTRCKECSLGIFRIRFLYDIFIDSAFSATHLLTCFTLVELLSDLNLSL